MSASAAPAAPELKNVSSIASMDDFLGWVLTDVPAVHVAFAYAAWHEPCRPGGAMDTLVNKLAELQPTVKFGKVDAEEVADVGEALDVAAVPTFYIFRHKRLVDKLEGADAAALTKMVERHVAAAASPAGAAAAASGATPPGTLLPAFTALTEQLKTLVRASPVMVFMKGTGDAPKCKFSRKLVDILKTAGVEFGTVDILTTQAVRQGLKDMSNWPTYPQVYADGELIGGVDVIQQLADGGELASALPAGAVKGAAGAAAPAAAAAAAAGGASGVTAAGAVASTTVPAASAAAAAAAPAAAAPAAAAAAAAAAPFALTPALEERLKALVNRSPVMLFMKGSPADPACGFSDRMVKLLQSNGVTAFDSFDILSDSDVRSGLKALFNWPTFPQLYVNGSLVGGLDILNEMVAEGGEPLPAQLGLQ